MQATCQGSATLSPNAFTKNHWNVGWKGPISQELHNLNETNRRRRQDKTRWFARCNADQKQRILNPNCPNYPKERRNNPLAVVNQQTERTQQVESEETAGNIRQRAKRPKQGDKRLQETNPRTQEKLEWSLKQPYWYLSRPQLRTQHAQQIIAITKVSQWETTSKEQLLSRVVLITVERS